MPDDGEPKGPGQGNPPPPVCLCASGQGRRPTRCVLAPRIAFGAEHPCPLLLYRTLTGWCAVDLSGQLEIFIILILILNGFQPIFFCWWGRRPSGGWAGGWLGRPSAPVWVCPWQQWRVWARGSGTLQLDLWCGQAPLMPISVLDTLRPHRVWGGQSSCHLFPSDAGHPTRGISRNGPPAPLRCGGVGMSLPREILKWIQGLGLRTSPLLMAFFRADSMGSGCRLRVRKYPGGWTACSWSKFG